MGYRPISEYGIIGNDDRFALVNQGGSIDWCCFPHGAGSSVFARILDDESGGHFAVQPTDTHDTERNYLERTNVLETTFETGSGEMTVTDFMPVSRDDHSGRDQHALYRKVQCTDGALTLELDWKPRLNYARSDTTVEQAERCFIAAANDERLHLQIHGNFDGRVTSNRVVSCGKLSEGDTVWFCLQYDHFTPMPPSKCRSALEETTRYWRSWADDLLESATPIIKDEWRDEALRSGLLLKLLINEETGGIYAAATTSLPEEYGSSRNWDYRYNWIRDAKFTIQALYNLGRKAEGHQYFEWFREISHEDPEEIQPVYGVHGETDLPECELEHLSGHRHSQPVRIGNAAANQQQHDIYGAIIQGYYETLHHDEQITDEDWESVKTIINHVCEIWNEPDKGIWEFRDEPRHYVHSKLLCWVALDRGIELAEQHDRDAPINHWREERETLRGAIMEQGYSESKGSFVQHFETDEALDAACLLIPVYEFLSPDHEYVQSTIDTVCEELLAEEGLVYRTKNSEAVADEHSTFVLCTFWLVDTLVLAGRTEEARDVFTGVLGYTTPLGLLSERIDPVTGELLGNFPQVFSHIGLINSAIHLTSAQADEAELEHNP